MKDQLQGCAASICALAAGTDYIGAPQPDNEQSRIKTLEKLKLLDTLPQRSYNKLTHLVCQLFNVPIGLISLVDVNRQWFKSVQGLPGVTQTSRDVSFCAWTLLPQNAEVLVVNDAQKDLRFKDNGLVTGEPYIRFYAGCPLIASNGHRLGTVCAIGREPRAFCRQEAYLLSNITEITIREIESSAAKESSKDPDHFLLQKGSRKLLRSDSCYQSGFCLLDFKQVDDWQIIFTTQKAEQVLEREVDNKIPFWELFQNWRVDDEVVSKKSGTEKYLKKMQNKEKFKVRLSYRTNSGAKRWVEAVFCPATNEFIDKYMLFVQIPLDIPQGKQEDFCYYWVELQKFQVEEQIDAVKNILVGVAEAELGAYDSFVTTSLIGQGSVPASMTYRGIYSGEAVVKKTFRVSNEKYSLLKEKVLSKLPQNEYLAKITGYLIKEEITECSIVQELCTRGNLYSAIQQGLFSSRRSPKHPSACVVLLSCMDIAKGLVSLHKVGIPHGHLVPNNILLTTAEDDYRGFQIKISDASTYSVLKQQGEGDIESEMNSEFMAPEWEVCQTDSGYKMCDMYSYGKLVHLMLGESSSFEDPNVHFRNILERIRAAMEQCVQQQPTLRPSAGDILAELETIFNECNEAGVQLFSRQSYEIDGPYNFSQQLVVPQA